MNFSVFRIVENWGLYNIFLFVHLQVESIVTASAKSARATNRIELLARPKSRPEGPFREPKWPVSIVRKFMKKSHRELHQNWEHQFLIQWNLVIKRSDIYNQTLL